MDLPPGKKAVGSKWVFKLKKLPDSSIDRFKARVVARGCSNYRIEIGAVGIKN